MGGKSDLESIIQLLRDDSSQKSFKAGGMESAPIADIDDPAVAAACDRSVLVIVLGIIAGLILGAIFYYAVMYVPVATPLETDPSSCSLNKQEEKKVSL